VVAPFVHGESAWHAHQGQRVVEYQQAVQTVSDPLLGWTSVGDVQYYVRQFRDRKGAITLVGIDARALTSYAGICGYLLAKGHARTSGASMIAGYLGGGSRVREALCRFARAYADQTERDHADRAPSVRRPVLTSPTGRSPVPAGRSRSRGLGDGIGPSGPRTRGAAEGTRFPALPLPLW
jgi:hypothetical protein